MTFENWKLKKIFCMFFSFLHKLSFKNSFCFLSILGYQTSFLVSKIENYFWKQKIRGKKQLPNIPQVFSALRRVRCVLFSLSLLPFLIFSLVVLFSSTFHKTPKHHQILSFPSPLKIKTPNQAISFNYQNAKPHSFFYQMAINNTSNHL